MSVSSGEPVAAVDLQQTEGKYSLYTVTLEFIQKIRPRMNHMIYKKSISFLETVTVVLHAHTCNTTVTVYQSCGT